jgi:tRNA modification GTPase
MASVQWLIEPNTSERIDHAVILRFDAPASFTGENVVELHLHGSIAVCDAVLGVLRGMDGFRDAEPGEFTRRALMNGKLDLSEAEGIGDLLVAETAAQRRQAVALLGGALGHLAGRWRSGLVGSLARIEAGIDFADEDLPDEILSGVRHTLDDVALEMEAQVDGSRAAERLREGFEVALIGPPNAGKSTLLNRLAGRDAALTSDVPGTTRDVIEVRLDLGGLPVTFLDMAGLRKTSDTVEAIGVARARQRADAADIRVFLLDGTLEIGSLEVGLLPGDVVVRAKSDIVEAGPGLPVSGLTGIGIDDLLASVQAELEDRVSSASVASHGRHRIAIGESALALRSAARHLRKEDGQIELAAVEITKALRGIDFLVGRVDIESVLGEIFASFCIGK